MKQRFAQRNLIEARGRGAAIALIDKARVIDPVAETGMGLKTHAARQIDGVG